MGPYPQAHQAGPGCHFVIAFLVWAAWFTKKPFVPYRMIKNRTMAAACVLDALDFFHYSAICLLP
ncbi:siderophore iron transporter mirA [Penicillium canescens]|nr:siderophore iron transporter mirA [Penicillium canescens]